MSLWGEIRRRNVHRVAIAYVAAGWLLIQVVETLFPVFGLPDVAIRVVVIVLAIGFVPAVILSWAFEWTPEGFRRDSEVTAPPSAARTRRFDAAIIAMLALAVAYFAVDKFVLDPSRDAAEREAARQEGRADALVESFGDRSIVVLPFENMSSDPEQEFLGDGLAEELLNLLARMEGLRVISRTSAFSFKGAKISSSEIARQLNVSYVLEGSVRKAGDRLRITAQLIDGRADAHVWSDTYNYLLDDIFEIQDTVAAEVVGQLKIELALDPPTAERHDPLAYTYFLQARHLIWQGDTQFEKGLAYVQRSLELDPDYLDAQVLLAWYYSYQGNDEEADKLVSAVEDRDPDNMPAILFRIWENTRDVPGTAEKIEHALELEPTNTEVLNAAIMITDRLWRAGDAVAIGEYVQERDPLNAGGHWNLARVYLNTGEYALAEQTYRSFEAIVGDNERASWAIGLAMLLQGKTSEALQHFQEHVADDALRSHGKTLAFHDLGRLEDAKSSLTELVAMDGIHENHYWLVGTAHAWIGATDEAFEFFEKQRNLGDAYSGVFRRWADSPLYANLRDDPRWRPFLASVELDPEYLASVEFNPSLPAEIRMPDNAPDR